MSVDVADVVAALGALLIAAGIAFFDWRYVLVFIGVTLVAIGWRLSTRPKVGH
ncbi:MAG: hypothetical protein IT307_12530 [Chloroflexi bacterium]|nr:hypothetical protein [Chloroflexota bacterium]